MRLVVIKIKSLNEVKLHEICISYYSREKESNSTINNARVGLCSK